LLFLGIITSTL